MSWVVIPGPWKKKRKNGSEAMNRSTSRKLAECEPGKSYLVKIDGEWQEATLWNSPWGAGGTSKYWSTSDTGEQKGLFIAYWSATQAVKDLER